MKITANSMELFYDKQGQGPPLMLLHGNGEDHHIFDEITHELSGKRTVYRLDTRGHGKSGSVREYHYQDMADDVAAFITSLQIKKPCLYGFSDGGIVGLILAAQRPELLSGLVISGVNLCPGGIRPFHRFLFHIAYLVSKDPKLRLMLTEPDITEEMLWRISIPVYLTAGEKDVIRKEHTRYIAGHIKDSKLRILRKETHSSYVVHSRKLTGVIEEGLEFIDQHRILRSRKDDLLGSAEK